MLSINSPPSDTKTKTSYLHGTYSYIELEDNNDVQRREPQKSYRQWTPYVNSKQVTPECGPGINMSNVCMRLSTFRLSKFVRNKAVWYRYNQISYMHFEAGRPRNRGSILDRDTKFLFSTASRDWGPPSLISNGYRRALSGGKMAEERGSPLVSRLKIRGPIPLFFHTSSWCNA